MKVKDKAGYWVILAGSGQTALGLYYMNFLLTILGVVIASVGVYGLFKKPE